MLDAVLARTKAQLAVDEPFCLLPEIQFAWAAALRIKQPASAREATGMLTVIVGPAGSGKSWITRQALRQIPRRGRKSGVAILLPSDWQPLIGEPSDSLAWMTWNERCGDISHLCCEHLDEVIRQGVSGDLIANWLDRLLAQQSRVLITLNQSPGQMAEFPLRLTSRLRGGLMATIAPFSQESKRQFLNWAARAADVSLADDVCQWILEQPPGTLRSLRSILDRLLIEFPAPARINDVSRVSKVLTAQATTRLPLSVIATQVAAEFGVTAAELRNSSRQQAFRQARQCAMLLAHDFAGWSMAEIGKYFGKRTHTSVSYSCRKFQDSLKDSASLRTQLQRLQTRLRDGTLTDCG